MMPLCSFRISVTDYPVMQHHIPEEWYPTITLSLIALQKCVLLDLLHASNGKMLPKINSELLSLLLFIHPLCHTSNIGHNK